MRRCAFSTNNNTTGTSDLTAPSRGRLFLTSVRHRRIAPHSATRRPARRTSSVAAGAIPPADDKRQVSQEKRSFCLHPDSTAGGRIARRSDPHTAIDRARIEDLPSPIRHIAPHATETRRLPVVPARRAAFPRRRLPTDFRQAAAARATMPVGSASDEYRPATAPDKKRAEEYSSSARSRSCRTTHSLGSI